MMIHESCLTVPGYDVRMVNNREPEVTTMQELNLVMDEKLQQNFMYEMRDHGIKEMKSYVCPWTGQDLPPPPPICGIRLLLLHLNTQALVIQLQSNLGVIITVIN